MRMASEVIVQTKSQVARLQTIVHPGDRKGTAAEIHIEIFNLRRPARRKAILQAETAGPTNESFAVVETAQFRFEAAVGKTGGCVEQDVVDRETCAAAKSAKPGIGELVGGKCIVGCAGLDIGFAAEHELANLPVVSNLAAAGDAARIEAAIGDLAPLVSDVETGIESVPIIDNGRRWIIRRWAAREIGRGGRADGRCSCHSERQYFFLHLTLHSLPPAQCGYANDGEGVPSFRRNFVILVEDLSGRLR